jgi:hypothetical protein
LSLVKISQLPNDPTQTPGPWHQLQSTSHKAGPFGMHCLTWAQSLRWCRVTIRFSEALNRRTVSWNFLFNLCLILLNQESPGAVMSLLILTTGKKDCNR